MKIKYEAIALLLGLWTLRMLGFYKLIFVILIGLALFYDYKVRLNN